MGLPRTTALQVLTAHAAFTAGTNTAFAASLRSCAQRPRESEQDDPGAVSRLREDRRAPLRDGENEVAANSGTEHPAIYPRQHHALYQDGQGAKA